MLADSVLYRIWEWNVLGTLKIKQVKKKKAMIICRESKTVQETV